MILNNTNGKAGTDSEGISPSDLRAFIEKRESEIVEKTVTGDDIQADIHRMRVGLALWSVTVENRNHEHFQTFYDQAYRWTREQLMEIDVSRLAELSASQTDPSAQQGGSGADPATEAGHTVDNEDQSPGEEAAAEVLDRMRQPERSLDELHGKQLHESLDDAIHTIKVALDLSDHSAFEDQNIGNVLFTGPPGTGKTTAAEGIAKALYESDYDFQFLPIKGHHFKNHLLGASEGAVEEIFHRADNNGPTLIFIDEFEEVASRDGDRHEVTQAITNTLLSLLSGGQAVEEVALVGATNRPDKVDKAIKSRFKPDIVEFTEPPADVKHEILLDTLIDVGVKFDGSRQDLKQLSYNGLVGRELEAAARDAIETAARRREESPYRVTYTDVQEAVSDIQKQQKISLASQ